MGELITKSGASIQVSADSKRIIQLGRVAETLSAAEVRAAAIKYKAIDGDVRSYEDSTKFDVIIDNEPYPPKAIFGLALSEHLGVEILSEHFTGGKDSTCFQVLHKLGFETVEKMTKNVERKDEEFKFSAFQIGQGYSKLETFELARVWVPNKALDIPGVVRFKNCVVLYVTLDKGNKEAAHNYHDQFLVGGSVFRWDSQNKNTLSTPHIKMIIGGETVVLFARVHDKINGKGVPFTYVGKLEHIGHVDHGKNIPIEVIFRSLQHPHIENDALSALYKWEPGLSADDKPIDVSKTALTKVDAPNAPTSQTAKTTKSKASTKTDWATRDEHNRNLGLAGELLVFGYEKQKLKELGREDLAEKVAHVAASSDSHGYDILSYDKRGNEMYIEVKTTRQRIDTPFFISRNEVEVSKTKGLQYWIYRVYDLKDDSEKANFYALPGPVENHFNLTPECYKASPM